ncbi:MAG: hypothetical protein ACKV19_24575 [Verrucomicrobiales bacterium]
MPTLRELAEKKTSRAASASPPADRPANGGLVLRGTAPHPSEQSSSIASRPAREAVAAPPPSSDARLLGTENLADIIPMFPMRGPGPDREWEEASMLPASSLGMILDSTTRTAWLACSRPGMPPLLIHPFPILGRLGDDPMTPAEPVEPQVPQTAPDMFTSPDSP